MFGVVNVLLVSGCVEVVPTTAPAGLRHPRGNVTAVPERLELSLLFLCWQWFVALCKPL
jgi:hypothetical protein